MFGALLLLGFVPTFLNTYIAQPHHRSRRSTKSTSTVTAKTPIAPAATKASEEPHFLRLPDELLLRITNHITGHDASGNLLRLALTHRRFSPTINETSICNATVYVHDIPAYIVQLSKHPAWARHIKKATLVQGHNNTRAQKRPAAEGAAAKDICVAAIRAEWPDASTADEQDLRLDGMASPIWALCLFVSLPNVEDLSLRSKDGEWSAESIHLLLYPSFARPVFNWTCSRLGDLAEHRLKALNVTRDALIKQKSVYDDAPYLDVTKFLTITRNVIVPGSISLDIPTSLEELNIHCDASKLTWSLL